MGGERQHLPLRHLARYLYAVPSGGSSIAPSTTPSVRQAAHLKDKLLRLSA
jgi:hypothetical protein